jgi:hypothetical protein
LLFVTEVGGRDGARTIENNYNIKRGTTIAVGRRG